MTADEQLPSFQKQTSGCDLTNLALKRGEARSLHCYLWAYDSLWLSVGSWDAACCFLRPSAFLPCLTRMTWFCLSVWLLFPSTFCLWHWETTKTTYYLNVLCDCSAHRCVMWTGLPGHLWMIYSACPKRGCLFFYALVFYQSWELHHFPPYLWQRSQGCRLHVNVPNHPRMNLRSNAFWYSTR